MGPSYTYTLSLHDALPISSRMRGAMASSSGSATCTGVATERKLSAISSIASIASRFPGPDRKSTRLNSSHANISYDVFCLKKKKEHFDQHGIQPKRIMLVG